MLAWLGDAVAEVTAGLLGEDSGNESPGVTLVCTGHVGPLRPTASALAYDPIQRLIAVRIFLAF